MSSVDGVLVAAVRSAGETQRVLPLEEVEYEIDLSETNLGELRAALARFIAAGRRQPRPTARRRARTEPPSRPGIRAGWATNAEQLGLPAHQLTVACRSDRGRRFAGGQLTVVVIVVTGALVGNSERDSWPGRCVWRARWEGLEDLLEHLAVPLGLLCPLSRAGRRAVTDDDAEQRRRRETTAGCDAGQ